MMERMADAETKDQDSKVVLMYPSNQLPTPKREFGDTLSAFTVLKSTFFVHPTPADPLGVRKGSTGPLQ